jgi:hypothetical protein
MCLSYLLQDWTTVQLAASDSLTQNESDWVDASQFCDVGIYVSTKQITAGVAATLHIETSPSRDSELFAPMTGGSITLTATQALITPVIVKYQLSTTTAPLARWVRWRFSSNAASVACFRCWLVFNSQGGMFTGAGLPMRGRDIGRMGGGRSPLD